MLFCEDIVYDIENRATCAAEVLLCLAFVCLFIDTFSGDLNEQASSNLSIAFQECHTLLTVLQFARSFHRPPRARMHACMHA